MTLIKPRTAPGVMELLPAEQLAFQRMLKIISSTYERYGFLPIETPVFEPVDVLLTKSGGETEKQVFFVQKTGDLANQMSAIGWLLHHHVDKEHGSSFAGRFLESAELFEEKYEDKDQNFLISSVKSKPSLALRFDLTVPLARYVAEHEHELTFPFRRYQMQRVYRGERTQRGRMNEFYQCDIDVIGKDSLSPKYDAEIPAIICDVFEQLQIPSFTINFSNRKILIGLLEGFYVPTEQQILALRELDKIDKIGSDKVFQSLTSEEIDVDERIAKVLIELVQLKGSTEDVLGKLDGIVSGGGWDHTSTYVEGYRELETMGKALKALGVPEERARLNLGIVRGLDYYTGTVYETTLNDYPEFGSVCSGGRYENLAGHYTKSKLPGVGISIGATRLFDQLRATDWAGAKCDTTTQVLITQLDDALFTDYLKLAADLRRAGIATEIMMEGGKIQKQMKYADRAGIRNVVLMGSEEKAKGTVTLKNLADGSQKEIPQSELAQHLSKTAG